MITKQQIQQQLLAAFARCEGNIITAEQAGDNPVAGLQLFQEPLVGFGRADDPLFDSYRQPGVVGPWYMLPGEWLPGARSVLSFFFPFTQALCQGERDSDPEGTSPEWLYGRIEGQAFLLSVLNSLCAWLKQQGAAVCMPAADPRFAGITGGKSKLSHPDITPATYSSNWSERHAAYACGLGTFSLTRAIITEKGTAGRLGSIITDLELEPDPRPYAGLYDYCTRCGACARRCPVGAISLEGGKLQEPCNQRAAMLRARYAPRYGCGKCQTGVPCQSHIPTYSRHT